MTLTQITEKGIKDGEIINADINANAAIAGSKVSPDFGSQNVVTTGKIGIGTTSLNSVFPLTIQAQYPGIQFLDAQGTDSFGFNADGNTFRIQKGVGGSGPTVMLEMATASSTFSNNLNANAGLDVSGNTTFQNGNRTLDLILADSPSTGNMGVQFRAGAADYLGLAAGGGTGTGIVIDSSNNIGIGTTAPSQVLHVNSGTGNICALFESTDAEAQIRIKDSGSSTGIIAVTDGAFAFENTGTGSLVKFTSDQKVGIGTTSLGTANLAVKGTTTAWGGTGNATATVGAKLVLEDDQGRQVSLWAPKNADGAVGSITNHHFYVVTGNASHSLFNHTTKDLEIVDGNLKLASTHGIDFSATSDGGGTDSSELFDDYEEGSFTPSYQEGSGGGNMLNNVTYTNTTGYYTKIGGCVTFSLRIQATSHTVIGGHVKINGLPYANGGNNGKEGGAFFNYASAVDTTNSGYLPTMHVSNNASTLSFYTTSGGAYNAGAGGTNWNLTLHITGVYHTF